MAEKQGKNTAKETALNDTPVSAPEAHRDASKPKDNSLYTCDEFAANPGVLGANQDIIRAALRVAGKNTATIEEAKKIVKEFSERKVK